MRHILNPWLRAVEKRRLRNGTPAQIRRALEIQSRMLFWGPRGSRQAWRTYGDIPCLEVTSQNAAQDRLLFYIHGGGFVFGSPNSHSAMAAQLAHRIGARAVLPHYRLAPEHPFPAAPDDVRAAWDGLIASGVDPKNIALALWIRQRQNWEV
jgi:acetyl esterase/lipase